jgi:hypothetical protein
MNFRKIHTGNKIFQWKYIKSKIIIMTPDDKKIVISDTDLSEMSNYEIERAKWKHSFTITPGQVKKYIEDNIA